MMFWFVLVVLALLVVLLCWHEGILTFVPSVLNNMLWPILKYLAGILLTVLISTLLK